MIKKTKWKLEVLLATNWNKLNSKINKTFFLNKLNLKSNI